MSVFRVQEHTIQASHIREYHRSLADEDDDDLKLTVKQYTPYDNLAARPGDVTIIAGHANGFPKELYEPLWDELYHQLKTRGINIRHIFIADVAFQGQSYVLNETKIGNDPSWFDSARDFFLMVNYFREDIKHPIVGVGHSMGGVNLINLAEMHPRLFTTMILIDPPLQRKPSPEGSRVVRASLKRRDRWPSRAAAEASFKRSPFYQAWEPRVLDLWLKYGLRELPTHIYPSSSAPTSPNEEQEVTLTTTKHQEVFTFLRAGPPTKDSASPYPQDLPEHLTHPDLDHENGPVGPYYRPEISPTFQRLQFLRPSVLWIFADKSDLSAEPLRADKLAVTGTGVGGSGGVKAGRVSSVLMQGFGHLVPFENVKGVAEHIVTWTIPELARWREEIAAVRQDWERIPKEKRSLLNDEYIQGLEKLGPPLPPRKAKI
ncbi:hypothetical protein AMS68_007177 [Peltaster fructicola]|uniref:Serine aminopeptidase S33 domain-containing protein n=1 Tax=Peltaster fructicola TaxID=286661 RepID=A0A6H0Y4X3_9PEZI|nr:hypothetical protein AMS68_007177 [Peltaster fructicola]